MPLRLSNYTKINIPKISSALMQWKNVLCNKKDVVQFSLGKPETVFTAQIYTHRFNLDLYELGLLVEIDAVPVSIWFSSWPLAKRLEGYLEGKALNDLPVDLRSELLEMTLKPMLSAIMFHTNAQIRVLNFLNLKPTQINAFSLGITLQDHSNKQESKMIMLMHDKLLPVMQRVLTYWPDQYSDFWYQQNTLLWIQAGSIEFSLQELNALESSDILIMESESYTDEHLVRLRLGSDDFFTASVQSSQLTIESGIQTMSDETNEAITSIEDVPVRLTFDLGDLTLPFSEIQGLTQGSIIDLSTPVSQAVTIRSLNRVIGSGELINIDGRMGVRIVKLLSKKPVKEIPAEDING